MTFGAGTAVAAGALVLGAFGIAQISPQGDTKTPRAEALAPRAAAEAPATQSVELQRRISGEFTNANLSEVLKWLGGQGVSFVADSSAIAGDKKLTMNIVNQPLGDVMEAIAGAFGGSWQKHGEVYTFARRDIEWAPEARALMMPDGKVMPKNFEMPDMKEFNLPPEALKELEGLKNFKMDPKALKELEGMKRFNIDPNALKELQGLKGFKLDPEELKELEGLGPMIYLHVEDRLKGMKEAEIKKFKLDEKELKLPLLKLGSADIPKLLDSLSDDQRAKHEKQGYLTPADLTPAQKKMLGEFPADGGWSLSFSINGKKLNIKAK